MDTGITIERATFASLGDEWHDLARAELHAEYAGSWVSSFAHPLYLLAGSAMVAALLVIGLIDNFVVLSGKGIRHEDYLLAEHGSAGRHQPSILHGPREELYSNSWPVGLLAGPHQAGSQQVAKHACEPALFVQILMTLLCRWGQGFVHRRPRLPLATLTTFEDHCTSNS